MIAPVGKVPELKVTISPASASEAVTVNAIGTPIVAGIVDPHVGD
jgi:hypothetical protein